MWTEKKGEKNKEGGMPDARLLTTKKKVQEMKDILLTVR